MHKIIVSQIGSRRRYMVPQILQSNNLLECLYTDSYCNSLLGRLLRLLDKMGISNAEIKRLMRRNPSLPKNKIYANDYLQFKLLFHRLVKSPSIVFKNLRFEGSSFWFIRKGVQNATILYNMFIENYEFAEYAKKKGLKIICDIYA